MSADVLVDKSGLIWGTESIVQKNYIPKVLRVIDSRASLYSSGVMGKAIWVVTSVSHPGWVAQKRSQVQWRSWVDGTRSAGMRIFVPEHLHHYSCTKTLALVSLQFPPILKHPQESSLSIQYRPGECIWPHSLLEWTHEIQPIEMQNLLILHIKGWKDKI